jgi:hypothetical protein
MATNVIRISNPLLADKAVDNLQTLFSLLTYQDTNSNVFDWFDVLYPKAEISENNVPQYRISNQRYENIVPNNRLKSFGFFVLNSDTPENENNTIRKLNFSLIVWFDVNKFNQTNPGELREYFIGACWTALIKNKKYEIGEILREKQDVWKGLQTNDFLPNDNPYSSFRIDFDYFFEYPICNLDYIAP